MKILPSPGMNFEQTFPWYDLQAPLQTIKSKSVGITNNNE